MLYKQEEFQSFERRYRANFFNSLLGFKSANLVGTKSLEGVENLAVFNSTVHIGANPPLVGFISRPDTVPRHTLENIKSTGYYTINHIHKNFYKQAHQTSAKYDAGISEFEEVGLTSIYKEGFPAPFVKESKVRIGLELREIIPIQLNATFLVIGEVVAVDLEEDLLASDGSLDFKKLNTVAITGLDTYHQMENLSKLPYARPKSTK